MGDRVEFSDGLDSLAERLNALIDNTLPLGIMSGLGSVDKLLGGFKSSEMTIIAARTSVGKTAFMVQMAREAFLNGKNVAFFSLETPTIQIMSRLFIGYVKISARILSHGGADLTEIEKQEAKRALSEGVDRLKQLKSEGSIGKLWVVDTRRISVDGIIAECKQMGELDMIFVDYVQLVNPPANDQSKDRYIQVGEVSRQLHAMAGSWECPVITGAQIRRGNPGDKPGLEDLRESGSLEQDADQVIILHRDLDDNGTLPPEGFGEVMVKKNRHGMNGVCSFFYTGRYFLFEDRDSSNKVITEIPQDRIEAVRKSVVAVDTPKQIEPVKSEAERDAEMSKSLEDLIEEYTADPNKYHKFVEEQKETLSRGDNPRQGFEQDQYDMLPF